MAKVNATYETLFIVDMTAGEAAVKGTVEKFKAIISENGEISGINEWGKRRLSYPINDKTEGYYVLVTFTAPTDFPAELERIFGITEDIMRSVTTRVRD
ncbi:MAG: 30S ribosomal protein S6 [Clostridia bacterium]|nr:30S ribosomal protein S6 [Clostridia bacterium]